MIKNQLKDLRKSAGMSQEELAEKSKVSRTMISALESQSKTDCKVSTLIAISEALGKSISDIFLL